MKLVLLFGGDMPDLLLAPIVTIAPLRIPHAAVLVKLAGIGGPANLHDALRVEVDLEILTSTQYARATHTP